MTDQKTAIEKAIEQHRRLKDKAEQSQDIQQFEYADGFIEGCEFCLRTFRSLAPEKDIRDGDRKAALEAIEKEREIYQTPGRVSTGMYFPWKHYETIRAALQADAGGWRPIESAPKYSEKEKVLVVGGPAYPEPELIRPDGEWWNGECPIQARPTHWMKVMPPNAATKEG